MSILLSKFSFNLNSESQEKLSLNFTSWIFCTPKKFITDKTEWFNKKNITLFLKEKDWIIHIWCSEIIYTKLNMVEEAIMAKPRYKYILLNLVLFRSVISS